MTITELQSISEAIATQAERKVRQATAAYVPNTQYCVVCRGRTMRGCLVGRHPYAYLVRFSEAS